MAWDEHAVKSYWDFESLFQENYFTYQYGEKLAKFISHFIPACGDVLDYGAGKGFFSEALLNRGIRTATFDLSPESTSASRQKFQKRDDYLGAFDSESIKQQSNRFDVVFLLEVVEHLEDKIRKQTLNQIHSLLKNEGLLIISTPNDENLEKNLILNPSTQEIFHRWQHCYSWTGESLAKEVDQYGFNTEHIFTLHLKHVGPAPIMAIRQLLSRTKKPPHLLVVARKTAR